jgi:purine-nucleoside phosphorylase
MTHSSDLRARLDAATASIRARDSRTPDIALVLGSGLSPFADTLVDATVIPFPEIAHMPVVTVPGHAGKLVLGRLPGVPDSPVIAALAGRVHFYEGHSMDTVVFPARMLIALGAKTVVLTNAAGGISPTCRPGDLVLISDHLNLQGTNPLIGPNDSALGLRFPDMTRVYDPALRALAQASAHAEGTELREGVYVALTGPSYETPAEIRMLRAMGADLVGMSTVPEAIAARHMGARVLGISCVTNLAAGVSATELSHDEVEHTAKATRDRFIRVVCRTLAAIGKADR